MIEDLVKNLKSSNIDLVIQDQLPITQNADITIESLELSKGKLDAHNVARYHQSIDVYAGHVRQCLKNKNV
jgi:uncharacterized ubiquitin-like protein YukD